MLAHACHARTKRPPFQPTCPRFLCVSAPNSRGAKCDGTCISRIWVRSTVENPDVFPVPQPRHLGKNNTDTGARELPTGVRVAFVTQPLGNMPWTLGLGIRYSTKDILGDGGRGEFV